MVLRLLITQRETNQLKVMMYFSAPAFLHELYCSRIFRYHFHSRMFCEVSPLLSDLWLFCFHYCVMCDMRGHAPEGFNMIDWDRFNNACRN